MLKSFQYFSILQLHMVRSNRDLENLNQKYFGSSSEDTVQESGHKTNLRVIQAFDVTGICPLPSQYRRENVSAYNAIACLKGNEPRRSGSIYSLMEHGAIQLGSGHSQPYKSHSGSKRTFLLDSTTLSFLFPLHKLYIGPHPSALFTLKMANVM